MAQKNLQDLHRTLLGDEFEYTRCGNTASGSCKNKTNKTNYRLIQNSDPHIFRCACMNKDPIGTELTAFAEESKVTYCYSHQSHYTVAFIDAMGVPQDTGIVFVQDDSHVLEEVAYWKKLKTTTRWPQMIQTITNRVQKPRGVDAYHPLREFPKGITRPPGPDARGAKVKSCCAISVIGCRYPHVRGWEVWL